MLLQIRSLVRRQDAAEATQTRQAVHAPLIYPPLPYCLPLLVNAAAVSIVGCRNNLCAWSTYERCVAFIFALLSIVSLGSYLPCCAQKLWSSDSNSCMAQAGPRDHSSQCSVLLFSRKDRTIRPNCSNTLAFACTRFLSASASQNGLLETGLFFCSEPLSYPDFHPDFVKRIDGPYLLRCTHQVTRLLLPLLSS